MKRFMKKVVAILLTLGLLPLNCVEMEALASGTEMTLTFASGAAQDSATRYLIYFNVEGTTDESTLPNEADVDSYWNNNTVYIDGEEKSGSGVNYSFDTNRDKNCRQVFLCLQYERVENGATSGSQIGMHLLTIPAGTTIGGIVTTTDIMVTINGTSVAVAKGVNFTYASGAAQESAGRYLLYFDVSNVDALSDTYWSGNKVQIDGVWTEINFTPSDADTMLAIVKYEKLKEEATSYSQTGVHLLEIPAGTRIGDLTVLNTTSIILGNGSITTSAESSISLGVCGAQDNMGRYLIRVKLDGKPGATYLSGNTIYIDGEKATVTYADIGEENSVVMLIPYNLLPGEEGKTVSTDIGTHSISIPKGSTLGNMVLTNSLTFEISGWQVVTKNMVTFALDSVAVQDNPGRYILRFEVSGIPTEMLKDYYWNNNTIYVDNSEVSGTGVHYLFGGTTMDLYLSYEQVQSGATSYVDLGTHFIKIAKGTVLGESSSYPLTLEEDVYIQLSGATGTELESDPTVRNEVSVQTYNDRRNGERNRTSVYLHTYQSPDSLVATADWSSRYTFAIGGVYYNGELQESAKLTKILADLYYVILDGCGISWKTGDVLTVDGMIQNGADDITFNKISFIRNADGSFSQYDETAENLTENVVLDDVYVDLNVDTYTIPVAPLLENGVVSVKVNGVQTTDYLLNKIGIYEVERSYENVVHSAISGPKGNLTYAQSVILYKSGDANADATVNLKDIVHMMRMTDGEGKVAQKAADLDQNGTLDTADRAILKNVLVSRMTLEEVSEAYQEVVFGVISDMHYDKDFGAQRRVNTRKALNYYKSFNAKVIFFNGDISDLGSEGSYAKLVEDIFAVYPDEETRPKMIMSGDNHEWHEAWQNVNGYSGTMSYTEVQKLFTNALNTVRNKVTLDENGGTNSHTVVNGYHFIGISSDGMNGASATYDEDTVAWLTEHLDKAVAENPDRPIFVGIHQPPKDTVCRSDQEYSAQLNSILETYPQVVVFSSHTHYTLGREDSIWQGAYTVVNTGALYYICGVDGVSRESSTLPVNAAEQYAEGLLVRVKGNSVDVERCDFWNNTCYGDNWVFEIQ